MKAIIEMPIYFVSVLFSTIFYNLCYTKINNHKIKINFKSIIVMIIVSVLILLNNSYENLWLKLILTTIIFCINFRILYNDNWKKILITYIFIYITIILIEIFLTNILLKLGILNDNLGVMLYTFSKFFLSGAVSIIEYLFFSINIIRKYTKKLINFFVNNINASNIAYLLFITCFVLGLLNFESFAESGSIKLIIFLLAVFIFLFVIVIRSTTKEEILKHSNQKLIEYNEKYGQFLDEYRLYKHNIKHKLAGMKSFGNKKINALIDDLLEEETTFSIKNNNLYSVPKGIKGIVAEKLYNVDISVIVDNKLEGDPFSKLQVKEFNSVSEAIGICLDNALEASIETDNPIITFDLYEDNEYIYIKTGNNFCNRIDIDELGDKYYSTKNRGSGLGLFSIMQNKLIKEKISIINDIYYIELKIKKRADD